MPQFFQSNGDGKETSARLLACWPAGRGAWERGERGIVSKFKISKQNKKAARKKRIKKGLCVGFIRGIYIVERRISAEFPQRVS